MRRTSIVAVLSLSTSLAPAAFAQQADAPTNAGSVGHAPPQAVTVDDAVKLAIDANPQLAGARFQRAQIVDQSNSIRGHMLPAVVLDEEAQHYDRPFAIPFPGLGTFVARNQNTNTFVAALGQPLTGLLRLNEQRNALAATADSADSQVEAGNAAIREAIKTGYLRYFEAKATEEIATTSEAQLREQEQLAEVRMKAGVLTKADLLRLEVAEANANQQEIQAQAQEHITRAALLTSMGFSPEDTGITFVEPTALEETAPLTIAEGDAQRRAVQKRPEAVAKLHDFDAATFQTRSTFYQLLPDVNLEAAYVNVQGQVFAQESSAYVGVKASWNIWEWGATWYQLRAAEEGAQAAAQGSEQVARDVRLDASTKLFEVRAAAAAVNSARAAIASAEESYRVNAELVRVGSATTTTELLDAQTALTQAKLNLVRANYEQAIASVALHRAIGE